MRTPFLLLLLLSLKVSGQFQIKGKVLSDLNRTPLAGASVYINNSTIGTITDAEGGFSLGPLKPGSYEVVVSFVSYLTIVHRVTVVDSDFRLEFRLTPAPKVMRSIFIMSEARRKQYLDMFREQFLGVSYRAERCELLNLEDVMFEAGEKKGEILAFADSPLVVINKVLGYKISFTLQHFYFDENSGNSIFYGFARYEDLDASNPAKWARNRRDAYLGSSEHFYRSIYRGKAEENNFRLYQLKVSKNMVVRESRYTPSEKFIIRDSAGNVGLQWTGRLVVEYRKEPAGKAFLAKKVDVISQMGRGVESQLDMIHSPAWMYSTGSLQDPMSIRYSGYWAYEKLADMLPVDFDPDPSP